MAALLWTGARAFAAESTAGPPKGSASEEKSPETSEADDGLKYEPEIKGIEDSDLRDLLESASQLYALKDRRPASVAALERRTQSDLERLREVLRSEGYYDATLTYRLDTEKAPIAVVVEIDPGVRYSLADFTIAYAGAEPVQDARPKLDDIGVKPGMPARAPDVRDAQAKAVSFLRNHGYPFAKSEAPKATVNHQTDEMTVRLTLDAGTPAKLGRLTIKGLKTVKEDYLREILAWPEGAIYDQQKVNGAQGTLNGTGLFSSVKLTHGDTVDADGSVPVTADVIEAAHRSIGAGAHYSTDVGFGGDVFWEHRNYFGRHEQLKFSITAAQIEQAGRVNFRKPAFLQREQSLVSIAEIANRNTDAFDQQSIAGSLSLDRPLFEKWRGTAGIAASYDIIEDNDGEKRFKLVGFPFTAKRSTADNPLNPTQGSIIDLTATPYAGASDKPLQFLRVTAGGSKYYSIDKKNRFILAGRMRVGSIVGEDTDTVPADKRFYAGGGGSVRGYEFQKVGPLDSDGDPTGGRSLLELSAELRIRITEKIGVVPFIDGGAVTEESYPSFDQPILWAGGLGLRYYTDIGPLRLDVAFPINGREEDDFFQFYISFGQAF